jgi:hypothetical protein
MSMDGTETFIGGAVNTAILLTIFGYLLYFKGKITDLCNRLKNLEGKVDKKKEKKK